ncbi:PadR family transcriptional regulator [Nocardiopsis composta]|uniref:DNA-binding PadR family transcriptional regulator n=1 Tax=Nocardiopsis composta TaxID=157465 RepID=A0A7W8VEZ8_9ACTN|nr:PadR family transcriptional regulator [Nocardiopsis composta]MBB5433585.1 DNA-binding PadR family transcriptional regulator [Nocardiopsis composta]
METRRSRVLDLAVLGHLAEAPMHGYELRKRLDRELGLLRAFSYGSLYPRLRAMRCGGLVEADGDPSAAAGRRSRIVYRLTDDGRAALLRLLSDSAPAESDDECFGVHFTLFGRTRYEVRMRILAGRRHRLAQRLDALQEALGRLGGRDDPYTYELHRHRAEALRREIGWLDGLIERERRCAERDGAAGPPR